MTSITNRLLWSATALLFVAAAIVAWVRVGPTLRPQTALLAPSNAACDLREGPCEAVFPNGARITFEIAPRDIPAVKKLRLRVRADGIDASRAEVDFSGVDMNMGFNRATLDPNGSGEFTGTGMLPVCVRARMTWEAKILLHTDRGVMAAPFQFDTFVPGKEPPNRLPEASRD